MQILDRINPAVFKEQAINMSIDQKLFLSILYISDYFFLGPKYLDKWKLLNLINDQ